MRRVTAHVHGQRRRRAFASAIAVCAAACSAPSAPSAHTPEFAHVGLITALCRAPDGALAACSQAGISWGDSAILATALHFRPVALAPVAHVSAGHGQLAALVVVGGIPAQRGEVALVQRTGIRARLRIADDLAYCVAVDRDGATAAVGGADGRVHRLTLPALTPSGEWRDHRAACRAVAFTADGALLASAGLDGVVVLRTWQANGTPLRLLDHTAGVECLAIGPDDQCIASGARDGKVRLHRRDGRLLRTFARLGAPVLALHWRTADTMLAGLADGRVLELTAAGDGQRRELSRADHPVAALAIVDGVVVAGGVRSL